MILSNISCTLKPTNGESYEIHSHPNVDFVWLTCESTQINIPNILLMNIIQHLSDEFIQQARAIK